MKGSLRIRFVADGFVRGGINEDHRSIQIYSPGPGAIGEGELPCFREGGVGFLGSQDLGSHLSWKQHERANNASS